VEDSAVSEADLAAAVVLEVVGDGELVMNTEQLLQELIDRLRLAAPNNIQSVVLYGSAARGEFSRQYSDLNVLCIAWSLAPDEMAELSPVVRWWTQDHRQNPPLFWTTEELSQAADVFAIEMLDIREAHRVLYGKDVLSTIDVPMNLHRVEVERELRVALLKVRQHYIVAQSDKKELATVLAKSAAAIKTLLRHALIVCDENVPPEKDRLLTRVEEVFSLDASGIRSALRFREDQPGDSELESAYRSYLQALTKIVDQIDRRAPKREWQRVR
jgi:hypothetical protein